MPIMKATADAIQPIYLNNKQICDDIIRKCSPSRRLESRELARILINPHIRNMYLKQWRANSQYHILRRVSVKLLVLPFSVTTQRRTPQIGEEARLNTNILRKRQSIIII
ncbi:PREDICTED: uncharacterized protein LOC108365341 isoform X1 [Rhagoletis zephyria]|uniref:uncharacterized protein LOC108365341 isoform X1 n=1 Tax=Rhagoletis zephyria TaxID=28612 RepID=UPI000811620A|nr:PREDICTED: uncharacterized protein LOC108365341 isoform X1 [Rhagoletis zephyria]